MWERSFVSFPVLTDCQHLSYALYTTFVNVQVVVAEKDSWFVLLLLLECLAMRTSWTFNRNDSGSNLHCDIFRYDYLLLGIKVLHFEQLDGIIDG